MRSVSFPVLLIVFFYLSNTPTVLAETPNIIFITVDTARADHMGFLGSTRGLTPNLDGLAKEGVIFEWAISQAPLTPVSHATIFTGTYPQFHAVSDFGHPLSPSLPFLPEILQKSGYHTAAFVASIIFDPRAHIMAGFDRGFDLYDAGFRRKVAASESRYDTVERRASDVIGRAINWLNTQHEGPFFIWVHLYDPHVPYDPPPPYNQRFTRPYDGEIAYVDACLGTLFQYLRSRNLFDSSLLVMMSDHGESLGAHGESTHGVFLYDETVHVPLVFKLPGARFASKRISGRVRLVDVAPTVLNILRVQAPPTFQGESLLPEMSSTKLPTNLPAYSETAYPSESFGWAELRALRAGQYLYVQAPKRELYNQQIDKDAEHNIERVSSAVASVLQLEIDQFRNKTAGFSREVMAEHQNEVPLPDLEQSKNLAALGYASSGHGADSRNVLQGADPKDKIEIANIMQDGMIDAEDLRYSEAIPKLQRVVTDSPNIAAAQLELGIALVQVKRTPEAIRVLTKAADLRPDSIEVQYELGVALAADGAWEDSRPHFELVAKEHPKWVEAQYSLASVYAQLQRFREAINILRQLLQIEPNHFHANLLLGRVMYLQGESAAAVHNLEKAVQIMPNSAEAHNFLADAYSQLGRDADAAQERECAKVLSR